MKWNLKTLSVLSLVAVAGMALAQDPTLDGQRDASYGAPLAIQNTQTQFGDNNLGTIDWSNGSEINAVYAYRTATDLYLFFAGNVESNYNKLTIIIDSVAGGQNRLLQDQSDQDFGGLRRISDDGTGNGMTFDAGFEADYWFNFTGGDTGGTYGFFMNYAKIGDNTSGVFCGRGLSAGPLNMDFTSGATDIGIRAAIDNTNILGVSGGNGLETPTNGFDTGLEYRIPLARLGDPTGDIKVIAFINGGGNDFLANQVIAGIGGGDNLGEPRSVNFENRPGPQFALVPGPAGADVTGVLDFGGSMPVTQIQVQFREAGTLTNVGAPVTVPVALDGSFTVAAPGQADYDITIKPRSSLRATVNANTTAGDVNVGTLSIKLGDIVDDNRIDLDDFLVLASTYEAAPPSEPLADLNNDGTVNLDDFLLLAAYYEVQGDN